MQTGNTCNYACITTPALSPLLPMGFRREQQRFFKLVAPFAATSFYFNVVAVLALFGREKEVCD